MYFCFIFFLNYLVFTLQASESGVDVHLQADPTKAELLLKQYKTKSTDQKQTIQSKLLEKVFYNLFFIIFISMVVMNIFMLLHKNFYLLKLLFFILFF